LISSKVASFFEVYHTVVTAINEAARVKKENVT
jgi:hypothetical protein